jgi:uncharacterized phage-associated protein
MVDRSWRTYQSTNSTCNSNIHKMSFNCTPQQVAAYFIEAAAKDNACLENLKLQKLVVLAHGWCLGLTDKPLLNEPPQAWMYGPIVASLYKDYKQYGNEYLTKRHRIAGPPRSNEVRNLLQSVWTTYGKFTALQLSAICHGPETPWARCIKPIQKRVRQFLTGCSLITISYYCVNNRKEDTVMTDHICKESNSCVCSIVGLEPDESCPMHGGGQWPPRCETCGKFIKRL